jgi:parallel beta-helix repeat protein
MRRKRYGELGVVFARTGVFLCLLLAGAIVRPRVSGVSAEVMLRNTGAAGEEVELNGGANLSALDESSSQGRIILADQQPGSDLGAKITAANAALGSERGEIRVTKSGQISARLVLSQNHDLVCDGDRVTLTLSDPHASIVQQNNTTVRGCTLSSSQTSGPTGGEIFSQGTSNVHVENVTFIGGGYHIHYDTVSNFSIKNTHHVSVTAEGASPILVSSSVHGQIVSPRIDGFTVPAGKWQIRLISVNKSSFVDVSDPVIHDVDASAVNGCGGVSFSASTKSTLHGGEISGLKNCDGVLTESAGSVPSSEIEITGTTSGGHDRAAGVGKYAHNGEGFDIFNSTRIRLSGVTVRNNATYSSSRQPGIEVSNSSEITISNSTISDNGGEGIKVDGSPMVTIRDSHTNHNGGAGILVMPAVGKVNATHGSPIVDWTPGGAQVTFSAVWPPQTKILIGETVYSVASFQSTGKLTLVRAFAGATGTYGYNVDSYVEITGGESLDNGQASAGLPAHQNPGRREGVYFAGSSGEVTGRVTGLHAADTQSQKTQTYGIRIENRARIVSTRNAVESNLAGGVRDSPQRSEIH